MSEDTMQAVLPDQLSPQEIEAFRRMPPARKLEIAAAMYLQGREWRRAALRAQHPDWSPEAIEIRLREVIRAAD
jgi:hypothetical protein